MMTYANAPRFPRQPAIKRLKTALHSIVEILARVTLLSLVFAAGSAGANSLTDPSRASINASIAVPVALVDGSAQLLKDGGQLSVTGVKTVGNMSVITLRGLAGGAEASVQVTSKVIEGAAIGVGSAMQATVSATGVLLISAGKALMFVPNEMGKSLLHHSRARYQ
ncbi:MAG: hypothetical protein ABI583_03290 [Betaproteobacteria bacterium]